MRRQAGGFRGVEKTHTFVQREEVADAQRVDLKLTLHFREWAEGVDYLATQNRR